MRDLARLVRGDAMPRRVIERRIHQHGIDAVGRKTKRRKRVGGGFNIEHDYARCDFIRYGIGARELREFFVDLDKNQIEAGDTPRYCKPGGTDTGPEIDHAIASL